MFKVIKSIGVFAVGFSLLAPLAALAQQAYPNKPIRVIVGYAAGGATDNLTRQIGVGLGERLGQSIVVDNKPGGSTVIAAQALATAAPDGYTVAIFEPGTVSMNQFLFKKLSYDPVKAFLPVTTLTRIPFGIMVKSDFPANTLKEFVAYVKANPGLAYGSSGAGNPVHLAMESFRNAVGNLDMVHVPYKGGAPAIQDLLGGQIPAMMMDIPSAIQHVRGGKIKVIAVTTAKRTDVLPDTPTIAESGYPGFEAGSWFGAFVPAGTPSTVIAKLNASLQETMASEKLQTWTKAQTLEPFVGTPDAFGKLVRSDAEKYGKLIQQLGLALD